jgi:hypothetical protein
VRQFGRREVQFGERRVVYSRLRRTQYQRYVLVAVFGVLARRWIARRGRTGEVGCEGAVAVGVAAWLVSPELRASIPTMLCYATSRVGRGRGLLGLTPPQHPGVAEKPTANAMAEHRDSGHGEAGRICDLDASPSPLDGLPAKNDLGLVPSQPKPTPTPERPTMGAEIGTRLRARANKLSDSAREAARLRGMQLIYGNGDDKDRAPGR